ncbi:DNA repair exonuclease SbcCD nuclease subunit [Faunimonas pinastri]|uniref:DNA repair exonuclease SbcCD nuclease subunit n=1 Tax=Faunimonas pinastri TaxID=1855383 RepID=A0A1H8Z121_9HYPH|nr:DNA repair exonuclease [Faunimonas pinastri]SEP58120.1 DNA repair exonuclease SbcCD nuclease subunit [Faunimonas pinastri]
MRFTFLHAADLHLGSPFIGLALKDGEVAERFAAASRNAFSSLVARAIEEGVSFVVIAGDVYDGEWKDTSIGLFFNREVAKLHRAGIPLFVLKGNHDAESVVTKTISLPDSVYVFPATKPKTFRLDDLKVALHGRSFPDRAVTENYALTYPDPVPGWFNIGVLHTSCDGRPDHANYSPCSVQDLATRGYDYWALGHVHEYEELSRDPWIVFPGNLQGRSVRECGPKGAVLVDVADGRVAGLRRLALDHARWADLAVSVEGHEREASILGAVEEAIRPVADEAEGRLVALRIRLTGATDLDAAFRSDPRRIADELQAVAHRCHDDIWLERVKIQTREPERARSDPGLSAIDLAATLREAITDPRFRKEAAELIETITARMPGGMAEDGRPLPEEIDTLLADAAALVLGRTQPAGC